MITLEFYAALKDHFPGTLEVDEQLSDVRMLRTYLTGKQLSASKLLAQCRSEEHTSELQSLMRISYAVFCLKKKKKENMIINNIYINNTRNRKRPRHYTTN